MEDPTLAQEMVKLLHDELERIRAQIRQAKPAGRQEHIDSPHSMVTAEELYELQQENIRLKEEVEALQAEVETFPRTGGSEYGSLNDLAYHAAAGSLDKQPHQDGRVESAIEDAIRYETEAAMQEEKVADAQQRMQMYKSECTQLEAALSSAKKLLKETKREGIEEQRRLETLQTELETCILPEFNPIQFLQAAESASKAKPKSHAGVLACSATAFDMPQDLLDLCVADGFITKNQAQLVWPKKGQKASHCISLSTTHRYNPRLNNSKGDWELTWDMEGHQGVRDLFCLRKAKWYYIGTYEWAGQACSPYKRLTFAKPDMQNLAKGAALFPETLPPTIIDITRSMIKSGTLQVLCTGWRRVGFNKALAKALQSRQPSSPRTRSKTKRAGSGAVPIAVPIEGSRGGSGGKATKRAGGSIKGRPRKKHRKS